MYTKIRKIERFSTKGEVDIFLGEPLFQINKRRVWYYGEGIVVAYSPRCFKVEGMERIEYGEEGLYATTVYHFNDVLMLKEYFDIEEPEIVDIVESPPKPVDGAITYDATFQDIHNMASDLGDNYREGERCGLVNGEMKVQNLFIMFDRYTLFFRGESKKNKVSGFQYML